MRIAALDSLETKNAIRADAAPVIAQCEADIRLAEKNLQAAGAVLTAATQQRESIFRKLSAYNLEYGNTRETLKASRLRALAGDVNEAFRDSEKQRRRLLQLADLISYATLIEIPTANVGIKLAEIGVEMARADYLEAGAALDRVRIVSITSQLREADAGAEANLENSASARILRQVEATRTRTVPMMQQEADTLESKRLAAKQEAEKSLFN